MVYFDLAAYDSIVQGTWLFHHTAGQYIGQFDNINPVPATGDAVNYRMYLLPGTYDFHMLYTASLSTGTLEFLIDGVKVGEIATTGAASFNNRATLTGATVQGALWHTIQLRVKTGGNAAMQIQSISIVQTG